MGTWKTWAASAGTTTSAGCGGDAKGWISLDFWRLGSSRKKGLTWFRGVGILLALESVTSVTLGW
jgi:hypothetical protein